MSLFSDAGRPITNSDTRTGDVPAVRRASAMLWHLGHHPDGLSLSRIARDLEVLPSTCLHILRELGAARLVAYKAKDKLYRLGSGVLSLARQLTGQNRFVLGDMIWPDARSPLR